MTLLQQDILVSEQLYCGYLSHSVGHREVRDKHRHFTVSNVDFKRSALRFEAGGLENPSIRR